MQSVQPSITVGWVDSSGGMRGKGFLSEAEFVTVEELKAPIICHLNTTMRTARMNNLRMPQLCFRPPLYEAGLNGLHSGYACRLRFADCKKGMFEHRAGLNFCFGLRGRLIDFNSFFDGKKAEFVKQPARDASEVPVHEGVGENQM